MINSWFCMALNIQETLYLLSIPGMRDSIIKGIIELSMKF
ncbi:MAG: hypothetical protein PWQ18_1591 [Clostridia bacterium]|nr:hypothetical protein [Clostridia bacterium]